MRSDLNEEGKVYSPDIHPYSFEGRSGVFGTLSSIVVAPIRVITRVVHDIFILPANLLEEYAKSLMLVSIILLVIGLFDFFVYKKWPLVVSQLPAIYYAYILKRQASKSTQLALKKRTVDINTDNVEELCNTVFDELNKAIKE